eukprot:1154028-Pelagomonas_calceolata.AAC.1
MGSIDGLAGREHPGGGGTVTDTPHKAKPCLHILLLSSCCSVLDPAASILNLLRPTHLPFARSHEAESSLHSLLLPSCYSAANRAPPKVQPSTFNSTSGAPAPAAAGIAGAPGTAAATASVDAAAGSAGAAGAAAPSGGTAGGSDAAAAADATAAAVQAGGPTSVYQRVYGGGIAACGREAGGGATRGSSAENPAFVGVEHAVRGLESALNAAKPKSGAWEIGVLMALRQHMLAGVRACAHMRVCVYVCV